MRVSGRLLRIGIGCFLLCSFAFAAGPSDQAAAERVLGPEWKRLARRAGMIFSGTVVSSGPRLTPAGTQPGAPSGLRLGANFVELRFRIDRPIVGVQSGQVLTIREWTGASSRQSALRSGERALLLLYRPSWLGLTSPVGGERGQVRLDSTGLTVAAHAAALPSKSRRSLGGPTPDARPTAVPRISLAQLERAIRGARGESR